MGRRLKRDLKREFQDRNSSRRVPKSSNASMSSNATWPMLGRKPKNTPGMANYPLILDRDGGWKPRMGNSRTNREVKSQVGEQLSAAKSGRANTKTIRRHYVQTDQRHINCIIHSVSDRRAATMAPNLVASQHNLIRDMILSSSLTTAQMADVAGCGERSMRNIRSNLRCFGTARDPFNNVGRPRSIAPPMLRGLWEKTKSNISSIPFLGACCHYFRC
jgi:hypothetical protein